MEVKSSGAEDPMAISVAPATSSLSPSFWLIRSNDGMKYSSHRIEIHKNKYTTMRTWMRRATCGPTRPDRKSGGNCVKAGATHSLSGTISVSEVFDEPFADWSFVWLLLVTRCEMVTKSRQKWRDVWNAFMLTMTMAQQTDTNFLKPVFAAASAYRAVDHDEDVGRAVWLARYDN